MCSCVCASCAYFNFKTSQFYVISRSRKKHGRSRQTVFFVFALSKFFASLVFSRPKSRSYRVGFGAFRVIRTIISMELIKTNTGYYFDYYYCTNDNRQMMMCMPPNKKKI